MSALDLLPADLLRAVLVRLSPRDLAAASCASHRLNMLVEDNFWEGLLLERLPRLAALLDSSPTPPAWWGGRSWRDRLAALVAGMSCDVQVFNREVDNEQEDFGLSCYDAACCLAPASAQLLLTRDTTRPVLLTACYLPMGHMAAVVEPNVAEDRLRLAPVGSSPLRVFGAGSTCPAGLCVGEEVEVQWKGRRSHPFGFWFGTVQRVRGNRITLMFRQYPRTSVWHRVKAPLKPGREAVVNGDCSFGYVGGLRRLSPEERAEWRRHGAPHPPAPEQLEALEAAAEEEWSDDEELDPDMELAAELEEELDALAPLPAAPHAAQAAHAAATAAGGHAAADTGGEEAAPAPAGPPAEPIAMQLGQAAAGGAGAVNGAAGAGVPVVLAAGPAAGGGASQPAGQQA